MQEQRAELGDLMTLPVIHSRLEILEGLIEQIAVDSLVGLGQGSFSGLNTGRQVRLDFLVLALFEEVLQEQKLDAEATSGRRREPDVMVADIP